MTYKRYISKKKDADCYLVDRISINISVWINCSPSKRQKIFSKFGSQISYGPLSGTYIDGRSGLLKINTTLVDNLIVRRANALRRQFPIPRGASAKRFGENVFESYVRLRLSDNSIKLKDLRERAISSFYRRLRRRIRRWCKNLTNIVGYDVDPRHVRMSLGSVEITWDLLTNPGVFVHLDPDVIQKFREIISKNFRREIVGDYRTLPPKPTIVSSQIEESESGESPLVGFLNDGTRLKIYCKEFGPYGVINRVERSLFKRKQIVRYIQRNSFDQMDTLEAIISSLAQNTFEVLRSIFLNLSPVKSPNDYATFESILRGYTPKHAHTICLHLKDHGRIATGKYSSLPQSALRVVQTLRRKGLLFVRRKYNRKNYEYIDWVFVTKQPSHRRLLDRKNSDLER